MIKAEQTYANAAVGHDWEVLQDIHLPSKNIAIYKRDIDALRVELADVAAKTIECRASGTEEDILSLLENYFDQHLPHCSSLLDDVSRLLGSFKRISEASSFRLLLTTVSTNMCRKFHTDINDLRLICTYAGPGTLWVPDAAINYKALQSRGADEEVIRDEQEIQQVGTGEVAILKGALYPDANPVLHRSPAIEADGVSRFLLRIDAN